jgi:hypothetical protein
MIDRLIIAAAVVVVAIWSITDEIRREVRVHQARRHAIRSHL